ncbi:hypothetical protein BYT27DRAFT_7180557 [Phlegmacium glaucopus]|nr:hypothetical protein BYT27DRAFT_7180557 [Phlegmacium glaucopus]
MPENRCTNCSMSHIPCTHAIPRQAKKKRETQQAYIRRLEDRLEKMDRFLQTAFPDRDIDDMIGATASDNVHDALPSSSSLNANYLVQNSISNVSASSPTSEDDSETDCLAHVALAEDFRKFSITYLENRFFGQSSGFMLAKETTTVKNELTGTNSQLLGGNLRRPMFWDIRPWEKTLVYGDEPRYAYPEEDLLWSLVSLYFEHANIFLPLLHRPTFEKSLVLGQHLWDPSFGMTVLLVCAVGSRYSEDPRVFISGDSSGLSCGWQYFCQVPLYRNILLSKSSIYDLQYYCLAIIYLLGTSLPNAAWSLLGLSVRLAIERGIHRRRSSSKNPEAEEELLKRSFWCLVCIDCMTASFLGRACLLMDEDFDVDYPIECDDEYWAPTGDSGQAFQQPSGKPSIITAFVYQLRLCEILALTLRTLYSTKKSKVRSGSIDHEWEHRIVAELDSSLNRWKDSLPDVLRWDPDQRNSTFFHQSVSLFSTFFYIQIQVHRPFLTKRSDLSLVSLAICTNAARSCSHLLEVALRRDLHYYPMTFMTTFTSGLIIVLNVWGGQKSGLLKNAAKEMANVQICLNVLKEGEKRWHNAGRLYDILKEISSLNEQPGPTVGDQTMSTKSDNLVSNSTNLRITPQPAILPNMTTMPPAPNYNSIGATTDNDWGLNNLLPSQMGIIHATPAATNYDGGRYVNFNDVASQGWAAPSARCGELEMIMSDEFMVDLSLMYPNGMVDVEMLPLWSEAPATFSGEEWDTYIANLSQTFNAA